MKSGYLLAPLALAMSMAAFAPTADAQPYPPAQPGYSQHPPANVSYAYAKVISVNPAYDSYHTMERQCDDAGYQRVQNDTAGGTIAGAIIGGVIGNSVARRGDRGAATVVGAVAGGAIGNSIAQNNNNAGYYQPGACRMVDVSHDDDHHQIGYDVEYSYKGEVYVSRMPYDPGDQLRVRVSVVPAEDDGPPPHR
jgi:uncharacterized protein YcfJ